MFARMLPTCSYTRKFISPSPPNSPNSIHQPLLSHASATNKVISLMQIPKAYSSLSPHFPSLRHTSTAELSYKIHRHLISLNPPRISALYTPLGVFSLPLWSYFPRTNYVRPPPTYVCSHTWLLACVSVTSDTCAALRADRHWPKEGYFENASDARLPRGADALSSSSQERG